MIHDANHMGRALRVPRHFYQKVTHTKCGLISNFLYIIILFQPSLIAFDLKHSPRDIALSRRVKSGVWRRLGMRIAKIFWRRWWEKLTSPIMTSCLALGYWERDTFSTGNLQSFFFFSFSVFSISESFFRIFFLCNAPNFSVKKKGKTSGIREDVETKQKDIMILFLMCARLCTIIVRRLSWTFVVRLWSKNWTNYTKKEKWRPLWRSNAGSGDGSVERDGQT